jgi:hypothetical protein
MTYTEDTWSRDSEGAEEAARALWEAENGPIGPDSYVDLGDYDEMYPYDYAGGSFYSAYYTGDEN